MRTVFVNTVMCLLLCNGWLIGANPEAKHIIIFGIDGLKPSEISQVETPNLDRFMANGSYTLKARAVLPTISSPNWASMIMGAGPAQHGIVSNSPMDKEDDLEPVCLADNGRFPSIFEVMREQRPDAVMGIFYDWKGMGDLVDEKLFDRADNTANYRKTVKRATEFIMDRKPLLTFLHLDNVDHAGHQYGYGTHEYHLALEEADRVLGELWESVKEAGIQDETVILISSDHGGIGKGHGGASMAEIQIPWIIYGPGIHSGKEVQTPVNTYDTAATVAYLLGLKAPDCWIGKAIKEAFGGL